MKKIVGFAMVALTLTACSDAGNRTVETPTNENQKAPASDPNRGNNGPTDQSTTTAVSDSSTVIDYDTAARKKQ